MIYGVAERNIEDWLRGDPVALSKAMGLVEQDLRNAPDAKGLVHSALPRDEGARETVVADFVKEAPLAVWLTKSPSFAQFFEDVRDIAQQSATCDIPNERDG